MLRVLKRDERRAANDLIFAKTLVLGMGAVLGAPEPVGYLRVERKIDTEVIARRARAGRRDRLASGSPFPRKAIPSTARGSAASSPS